LPATLAPGASDTFTVQLDTTTPGTKSGQISIVNNDANENPYNFSISGTVIATAPEITVTFGSIAVQDGNSSPATTRGTLFGSAQQGGAPITRTFTVRNDGNGVLNLGTISAPTGFTVTDGLPATLAPGASDTFTVQLDTTTPGVKSGQISFTTNDANESPYNFSISGTVIATTPEISVSFGTIDVPDGNTSPSTTRGTNFGNAALNGTPITRTFTVRNSGTGVLNLGTVSVPAGFTLVEGLSSSLAPGASDTFTVQLDTTTAGTKSGQISFTTNDANESLYNFSITGKVV
jgi:hypothetical protein